MWGISLGEFYKWSNFANYKRRELNDLSFLGCNDSRKGAGGRVGMLVLCFLRFVDPHSRCERPARMA